MISSYQMAAECTRYLAGTYKSYFHDQSPFLRFAEPHSDYPSRFQWIQYGLPKIVFTQSDYAFEADFKLEPGLTNCYFAKYG
jgi:hypothetical protein